MKKIIFLIVLLLAGAALYSPRLGKNAALKPNNKKRDLTVLISGYGGKDDSGNWTGESAPFLNKMEGINDLGSDFYYCQQVHEGKISGNRVLVATTGMAKVNTTACVSQVMDSLGSEIAEVIVVGTGGVTPSKGGANSNGEFTMLGDVCISYLALDFDQQYYSSDNPSGQANPQFKRFKDQLSSESVVGSSVLANELNDASRLVSWPEVPEGVSEYNKKYHQASRKPKVWNSRECMEVSGDLYWNDLAADETARKVIADQINKQNHISVTQNDVIALSSMEAIPAGVVVEKYNKAQKTNINFAYVRGASNFDQVFLTDKGQPATSFLENRELKDHSAGSEYAIQTSALPVLKMLEKRSSVK